MAHETISASFNFGGMSAIHPSAVLSNSRGKAEQLAAVIAERSKEIVFDPEFGAEYTFTVTVEMHAPDAEDIARLKAAKVAQAQAQPGTPYLAESAAVVEVPATSPSATAPTEEEEWQQKSYADLKVLGEELGLAFSGNIAKSDLIDLIAEHYERAAAGA